MRKNVLVVIFILVAVMSSAQELSKDETIDLIVQDICTDLNENPEKISASDTMEKRQTELGLIMMHALNNRKKDSRALRVYVNKVGLQKVGETIGIKLGQSCRTALVGMFTAREFLEMSTYKPEKEEPVKQKDTKDLPPNYNKSLSLIASLTRVQNGVISYAVLTDKYQKEHVFLIVDQFKGSALLDKKNYGQYLKVYYRNMDYFDLDTARYKKKKVVNYIEDIEIHVSRL